LPQWFGDFNIADEYFYHYNICNGLHHVNRSP
jgi:hypothetical protein